ncbi:M14 family metallopeptidase [Leucothrix pacifica]|uniref:Peptidase n=1 Tax=Leucothrix pacifica TaxID=1247513 RepID=A0A317C1Z8_9GAMM|nr:M14 family metallocarboxypeptidase [Leucothrix pacifica]PWQ92645.1 peptidase [Leucothrix pacifica]
MSHETSYPIGTKGIKWGDNEKQQWLAAQSKQRDFFSDVLPQIQTLAMGDVFELETYGELNYLQTYPLHALKTKHWQQDKPSVLITGGVHGYETSGVQGALRFARLTAADYQARFNLVIIPCVSPWGYETINRWNPKALDPNRSFFEGSGCEESELLMAYLKQYPDGFWVHFDLHETTDSDSSEFRPALAARDAIEIDHDMTPDGFYTVGDSENPQFDFQKAVIDAVRQVTPITQADEAGEIIGCPITQEGVINYPMTKLSLCGGLTNAQYSTTTEVYPDNPDITADECNRAQVAAVCGGLDYLIRGVTL